MYLLGDESSLLLFANGFLSVVRIFIAFTEILARHFLVCSCLNGNSLVSCFTRNFLISPKFRCCDLNQNPRQVIVPSHCMDSQNSNSLSFFGKVWVVRSLLLCRLCRRFCHLHVVIAVATVVVIFVIVIVVVAIVVVVVAIVIVRVRVEHVVEG